jgi:hypothetical protein
MFLVNVDKALLSHEQARPEGDMRQENQELELRMIPLGQCNSLT